MNILKSPIKLVGIVLLAFLISCAGSQKQQQNNHEETSVSSEAVEINKESKELLAFLEESGDYANSRNFPSIIKASTVYEELNGNNLIVDLRDKEVFQKGHIEGAVNVDFKNLPDYFKNEIHPDEYDKIVLACYAGQISSYATSLLRLAGYGNVYSMKWGMSSWNKEFANDSWFSETSSEYENRLETVENEKAAKNDFPLLNTNETTGQEILVQRIKTLFEAGYSDAFIMANSVFQGLENYYIINYDRRDKYESGHIPGAIRYKPGGTLGITTEMETIPAKSSVVIYCNTGQNSGFVTAYLRLFGYNARSLMYGNNSFMHNKMVKDKNTLSWIPFSSEEIENYPFVKG